MPNRTLGSEIILNYNQPRISHAHKLYVGTAYKDPPVKVKEILRMILLREPRVLQNPQPQVRTIKYNDFSIDYELKFWLADYGKHPQIMDAIMTEIWYAFKFYGIEIPFPIRTIHAKGRQSLTEEESYRSERVDDLESFLRSLHFLNEHLTFRDFDFLAQNCFQRSYRPGEFVVHRGELGDALYIVRDNWCEVRLSGGETRRIEAGLYFGEMGLLSLTPRSADVAAGAEGSRVIRIDRECMTTLFKRHPGLRETIVQVRDERLVDGGHLRPVEAEKPVSRFRRAYRGAKDFLKPW